MNALKRIQTDTQTYKIKINFKKHSQINQKKQMIQMNKVRHKKETLQQIPMKFKGSLEHSLKTYIPINCEMEEKKEMR